MKKANKALLLTGILIGADIELFLKDKFTGEIVSAEGLIKGTKDEPFNFDPANKYFATSLDNVLTEFCIPPTRSMDEWVSNIEKCVKYINDFVPQTLCTVAQPAAILDLKWLQTPHSQRFGCEPDFNVWERRVNDAPKAKNERLRSAGGHIHIGYDNAEQLGLELKEQIIKALDVFVGIPSVLQEPDNERKLLYGKAGAFRIKDYGVEYRTVSNYYLETKKLTEWAFRNAMEAVNFVNLGGIEMIDSYAEQIQAAINTSDKVMAENIINAFDVQMA